jgi:hypothetical protein
MNGLSKNIIILAGLAGALAFAPSSRGEEQLASSESKPATGDEIAGWIKDLDDARYSARETATQHLLAAGAAALDPLLAVANGEKPEPADRAIWIMRRMGRSRDNELALAALERLVQLENRPSVVAKAETELAERGVNACEQRLGPLGAEVASQLEQFENAIVPVLIVRLSDKWQGTTEDLRQITQLRQVRHFRLEGAAIGDDVVKMFADKDKLAVLQLFDTKVTPAAVDAVKEKHPTAMVYVRNQALLGVIAENHAAGVMVTFVQPGSAAATAGIVVGDVIAAIDGHSLPDFDRLTARIAQHRPGDKIDVDIVRNDKDGRPVTIKLRPVLGSRTGQE